MLCEAAVLRYCIVALAVSVCVEVAVMEKLQKMYFISLKADDKTSQCNVDVRMMYCVLGVIVFLCSCFGLCRVLMGAEIFVSWSCW